MPQFVTMGELLVDFICSGRGEIQWIAPTERREAPTGAGEPVRANEAAVSDAPSFIPVAGGAPANVAVGLSLFGKDVGFIGKVGDDPFGRGLVEALASQNVDTRAVSYSDKARTMLAFVSLSASGERDFVFYRHPSADMLISPDDVPAGYMTGAEFFHFGSISLIAGPARETTLGLVESAKKAGVLVSFDPNLRDSLWPSQKTQKNEVLGAVGRSDIVKLSEEEAAFLTGKRTPKESALVLLSMGPRLVVVTGGSRGSVTVTARYAVEVDAFEVPVADTTGAGDAFCAGMLSMISETGVRDPAALTDLDLIKTFRFANAAGAITVTRRGAIPALPTRDEVELFMKARRETPYSGVLH